MCIRNSCNPEKIIKKPSYNNDDDENENMSSVTKIIKQVENFLYLFSFWLFYEAYDERLYIIHSFADVFVLCCKKKINKKMYEKPYSRTMLQRFTPILYIEGET